MSSPAHTSTEPDPELVAEFVDRLSQADRRGVLARVRELTEDGISAPELLAVVAAAQREVGRLWQLNAWTVAQEHAATAVSEAAVHAIVHGERRDDPRGRITVVCAEGEWHVLPARIVAERLIGAGFGVNFVGGSVPPEQLHGYLPAQQVQAVVVSCTLSLNLGGAGRTVAAVHAAGLRAAVGGAAFGTDGARAEAIGADGWGETVEDLIELLDGWVAAPGPPRSTPALNQGEHIEIAAKLDALVTDSYAALEARHAPIAEYTPVQLARTREDLAYHFRYLAAALLVGDDRVYLDMIPWLTELLMARGVPPVAVVRTLQVLEEVLTIHGHRDGVQVVRRAHAVVPEL